MPDVSDPSPTAESLGMLGEDRAAFELEELHGSVYELFHDLYLSRPDQQGTTQIDHVVLSPYGIFVIETKNLSGWIFGCEEDRRWTQALPSGKRRPFQNPLRQNYLHTKALSDFLQLPEDMFFSIIYLAGGCEIKKALPGNVVTEGLVTYIESHQVFRLTQEQLGKARALFGPLLSIDKATTREEHIRRLRERHVKKTVFTAA